MIRGSARRFQTRLRIFGAATGTFSKENNRISMSAMKQVALAICSLISSAPVNAASDEVVPTEETEYFEDRIHSKLPLYTFEWQELWPRNFAAKTPLAVPHACGMGTGNFRPILKTNGRGMVVAAQYRRCISLRCDLLQADEYGDLDLGESSIGFFALAKQIEFDGDNWKFDASAGRGPGQRSFVAGSTSGFRRCYRELQGSPATMSRCALD